MLGRSKVVLRHPLASLVLRVGGYITLADVLLQPFEVAVGFQQLLELLS